MWVLEKQYKMHNAQKTKQKIILGILPTDPYNGKDAFLKQVTCNGFVVHSVSSKIREMAKYLLKMENVSEISQEDIDKIRSRGYAVNKLYWVNLLLTSVPENEDYIIIEDVWYDDLYEGYVTPVVSDPILVPNVDFVKYPTILSGNVEIKRWIKEIEEKLYNTK